MCRPGSAVPLVMFLTFNAALLSVPGPPGDPLAHLVVQGGPVLRAGVTVFSLLAIFTSFAGTSIGSLTGPPWFLLSPSQRSLCKA